ncbi:hypothetical protein ACS5PU_02445 [Pedobacter sp. GSP4]|uniref:hypothetical protein n=1 Tax=Pedobacter sp. GSP4 TaxID=3453716 RepID=UPI003EEF037E
MMKKSFLLEYLPLVGLVVVLAVVLVVWAFRLARKAGKEPSPLAHRWEKGVDELDDGSATAAGQGLMGRAVEDEGVVVLAADGFGFADSPGALDKGDQLGLLADVQQEIKSICTLLEEKDGSKEDFFSMFGLVRAKYPKMSDHAALAELRPFIRERVPFHLSDEELDSLWG